MKKVSLNMYPETLDFRIRCLKTYCVSQNIIKILLFLTSDTFKTWNGSNRTWSNIAQRIIGCCLKCVRCFVLLMTNITKESIDNIDKKELMSIHCFRETYKLLITILTFMLFCFVYTNLAVRVLCFHIIWRCSGVYISTFLMSFYDFHNF